MHVKVGDNEFKRSLASLKDGLLFADRNSDKKEVNKFLTELKKYEDVEWNIRQMTYHIILNE